MIGSRLAGLVHESVQGDAGERRRHQRFIVSRMIAGVTGLACLPALLVCRGVPSLLECGAILFLVGLIASVAILSRTGSFALAHAISSGALAGLIGSAAAFSAGMASAVTVWLTALPLEALLFGSPPAAVIVSVVTALAAGLVALLPATAAAAAAEPWPMSLLAPAFALAVVAHTAVHALAEARLGRGRAAARSDEAERSLLAAIDDLVTWHDRNGYVLQASAAASKLLAVPADALRGGGLLSRVHVSDRPAFLKAISDAAAGGRPTVVQLRLAVGEGRSSGPGQALEPRPAGLRPPTFTWGEMRAHPIKAAAGPHGSCAVVAITRDISVHRRHAEELEGARAAAERAGAAREHFLATVSHELRTPLNAIIGFAETLSRSGPAEVEPERRNEYLAIIRDSGVHLLELVNALLDMSRIETGKFELVPDPFDIAQLAHGCCDLMALKAEQAGIVLKRDIPGQLPKLVADRRACKQIMLNLLANAIKFTAPGGQVTVAVARAADHIVLNVADTGIGIAADDLPKLGNPFFQVRGGYDRQHEGAGLGLSVVRGLVGLHQGTLTIESGPGEGTSATVTLPINGPAGTSQPVGPARIQTVARRRGRASVLKAG